MHSLPSAIKPIEGVYTRESMYATSSLKENRESSKGFSSLGRSTGAKVSSLIKTPKSKKFLDDSQVKYSSPDFRSTDNEFFPVANTDDFNCFRRQSIDTIASARNGGVNSTMGASNHPINRFDAISENDFEPMFNSEKFLPYEDNSSKNNARLSELYTRNLKQKPHLKSSYPLEGLTFAEVDEKNKRDGRQQRVRVIEFQLCFIL
jgi:hypothetical protein